MTDRVKMQSLRRWGVSILDLFLGKIYSLCGLQYNDKLSQRYWLMDLKTNFLQLDTHTNTHTNKYTNKRIKPFMGVMTKKCSLLPPRAGPCHLCHSSSLYYSPVSTPWHCHPSPLYHGQSPHNPPWHYSSWVSSSS